MHHPSFLCGEGKQQTNRVEWCHLALADPLQALVLGECRVSDPGASAAAAARLTEITLSSTHLSETALQSVLSGCPALRSVMLKHVKGPRSIRIRSCRSLLLLGVWQYKNLEELTVEDAPCLERLLGDIRLSAAINVSGAPKLTAFGYVVISLSNFLPDEVIKQILAISVKFSRKEDIDKLMSLLILSFHDDIARSEIPLVHHSAQSSDTKYDLTEDDGDTIVPGYYEKLDPIVCHEPSQQPQVLQIMRIESKMCAIPEWVKDQRALLSQSHMASSEAEIVFEDMERHDLKDLSIELVNTLPDPFDSDAVITNY
ncbi:hypothetical protein E2562_011313 [Oryza meyeriana var. granulata]|uniref:F-box/LRR-repeat protein 15/At3g58940/PEG3-like LRR domain-containing protein n=1 Tax=Oryza meyeriana var. granulata TaxID=110450 RepID=A0A6G1BX36_9ORYZ|nr:hypothetical protein E2562_011313 [Oryza meyeriana var. granulata]